MDATSQIDKYDACLTCGHTADDGDHIDARDGCDACNATLGPCMGRDALRLEEAEAMDSERRAAGWIVTATSAVPA